MRPLEKLAATFGLRPALQKPQPAEPEVLPAERKPAVGLFALLTDDQKHAATNSAGQEDFGPQEFSLEGKSCH